MLAKKTEPIEIEREEYFAITCSSDEGLDLEMKFGKDNAREKLEVADTPDVSPEIIRKKAKERRNTVFHKLPANLTHLLQ